MKKRHLGIATAAALGLATSSHFAAASSHREAPAIAYDPAADNTDVYAWVTPGTHQNVTLIVNYIPFEEPASGPNFFKFSDDVLYEIHIARGNVSLDDVVTYQIRFTTSPLQFVDPADLSKPVGGGKEFFAQLSGQTQTYTITKIENGQTTEVAKDFPVAPWNIGPRTDTVVYKATYDDAFASTFVKPMAGGHGRAFAGPRDDGFYADLGGIFDLANLRPQGVAQDGLSGYNVLSIAMEIPAADLSGTGSSVQTPGDDHTLGIWASSSRQKVRVLHQDGKSSDIGPWVQVSRLGIPLVNEALIGLQDKDKYNRTTPSTDVANFGAYFLNPVIVRDAEAVGIYAQLGVPQSTVDALKTNRIDILDAINLKASGHDIPLSATGDVLRLDLGMDTQFPNGRSIPGAGPHQEQVDVTDAVLTLLLSKGTIPISDGVSANDRQFLTGFPYLALPWQGFAEGHGKVPVFSQ